LLRVVSAPAFKFFDKMRSAGAFSFTFFQVLPDFRGFGFLAKVLSPILR
jgi:hypothetical protein